MQQLTTQSQVDEVLGASRAVLLEHGATCPISANARDEMVNLARRHPDLVVASLEVTGNRALTSALEKTLDIEHESPQVLVIRDGALAWLATHYEITADAVERELGE